MEVVKDGDMGADNIKSLVYVLNTALGMIESQYITQREIQNILGVNTKNTAGNPLHAQMWDSPPEKGEAPKLVDFVRVISTLSMSHCFDLRGVAIKTPRGHVAVEFGTVLIMKMNPLNGRMVDIDISREEIESAVLFFKFKSHQDIVDVLGQRKF